MSTSIEERMSKKDKKIWDELHASIRPHLNRLERDENNLTTKIIIRLKKEISSCQEKIKEIEAKYEESEFL